MNKIKWNYCEGSAPPPISRSGISADIMIEYYNSKGHLATSRGRCFTSYIDGVAQEGNFYVYEYDGAKDNWTGLGKKANRWYHLGGETTTNNSNPILSGNNCKLSFPYLKDKEVQSDMLLIKWEHDLGTVMTSIGFYHKEDGFCIFKDYQCLYDEFLLLAGRGISWVMLEY